MTDRSHPSQKERDVLERERLERPDPIPVPVYQVPTIDAAPVIPPEVAELLEALDD